MDSSPNDADSARRVYVDTMVFVYQLGPKSSLSRKAQDFFKDIEAGRYIGVTTSFTAAEFIAVFKELLLKARGSRSLSPSDIAAIKGQVEEFISRMGMVLYDADELATVLGRSTIFGDCEPILEEATPVRGTRDGRIRVIGGADALHLVMAIRASAELFGTFDEGFRGSERWVEPLLLSEVY